MTRVLHVLDHSKPLVDGYCVRSGSIVRFQAELGLDPVVVTSARQTDKYGDEYRGELDEIESIRYHRTATAPESSLPFVPEMQRLRRMLARLKQVVALEKPDIIHAHSPCLWGLAAGRVARAHGIPLVYEVRGFWEDALVDSGKTTETSLKYKVIRSLESRVCRSANVVTAIAEGLRSDIIDRGCHADKVMLIPNGVDTERFGPLEVDHELRAELNVGDKTLVGYVGSLFSWEGVEDLVRSVPRMISQAPDSCVLILGGGEREATIKQLIEEMGVQEHVKMLGRVPHSEVGRYYSILDVLVYPRISTRNTELCTPLKPLEAMAMQKAIVGSNVGGIQELIEDGTGLTFGAGQPDELADCCVKLILDPDLRRQLGEAARTHMLENRSWMKIAERYMAVYAAATGSPIETPAPAPAEPVAAGV